MADKDATVYIVDVGTSMGQKHHGRDQSDLECAMIWLWDKITVTIATDRKSLNVGVVGLRTTDSENHLVEGGVNSEYNNISVFQELGQLLMPDLRRLLDVIKPSTTNNGDAISALIVAIDMITKFCRKLKYTKKIVLVTNGDGHMDPDDVSDIASKLKEENIDVVVLGVDFDDAEFGFKEDNKSKKKSANEKTLAKLTEDCEGVIGTLQQAIAETEAPRIKIVKSQVSRSHLKIGNPELYNAALDIEIERYPRVMIAKPKSASSFIARTELQSQQEGSAASPGTVEADDGGSLTGVRYNRIYEVKDQNLPGGHKELAREELSKGYSYGRTAVAISETDESITLLETSAGLEVIGFIPQDKFDRYLLMSNSFSIIASRTDPKAILALSSFIHALYELEDYAVARFVKKDNTKPLIVLLAPSIDQNEECLIEVQLPFAEDIRSYQFPPLDRVLTVAGKLIKEHRNLPSDDLMAAMDDYVDKMDLSKYGKDDEGKPSEYMTMTDTYSAVLHRLDQAIRYRAIHPDDPIPPPAEILTRYSRVPEDLEKSTKTSLQELMKAANVKKVPPRAKGRKRAREEKPMSGLDVSELLSREKRKKISPENPIPEFKQLLSISSDESHVRDAVAQLSTIIKSQIEHSMGDSAYDRVVEELGVMRSELVDLEYSEMFNEVVKDLKGLILLEKLGGDRKEMWHKVRNARLGLIDTKLHPQSTVTEQEAKEFLTFKV